MNGWVKVKILPEFDAHPLHRPASSIPTDRHLLEGIS